ncbi:SRAP domain containing protein [Pyrenophora teres f. maculata]|nr:SRAP domain containing protein [Pyrenophora teres f. maculata]
MCGRYVLALRPSEVRQQLEQSQMHVEEAPNDDDVRQSYNFAPGYHGLVYRAEAEDNKGTKYKLQSMQWGLVPFWTKRNPDYGNKLKTINCRDDSLVEDRGMWTTMKKKKRCIVVAQGFYEWQKKNGGKEKIPHFVKRQDGQLMCFAGLWDRVRFEDSDKELFTYTIITTDSNKQLNFLHDRMPVIFDNGSDAIRTWLDLSRTEWNDDLQSLLRPFGGKLECYPVSKDAGKVGNNSPSFLVPIDSAANKNNIANFFQSPQKQSVNKIERDVKVEHEDETRATTNRIQGTEDNAPLPVSETHGIKREHDDDNKSESPTKRLNSNAAPSSAKTSKRQGTRSATNNGSAAKTTKEKGSRKITAFFTSK